MTAYYNEIDPNAAQRLRNLIDAGHIAPGIVDERSIEDAYPSDLRGFTQCHFFAGIGVWSYALRQAGWADNRPVWTGSCPCQPFSAAGKGAGFADERHLWPAFCHLIKECAPATVIGEQVASKDVDPWIDLVQTDLEALGYAVGAVAFPSAGVGAPHIRDRTYWVADTEMPERQRQRPVAHRQQAGFTDGGEGSRLANTQQHDSGRQATPAHHGQPQTHRPTDRACGCGGALGGVADNNGDGRQPGSAGCETMGHGQAAGADCGAGSMGDPSSARLAQRVGHPGVFGETHGADQGQATERASVHLASRPGPTNGLWRAADWLLCRDEKWRPVEPGTFPLAASLPMRMGSMHPRLRGLAEMAGLDKASLKRAHDYRVQGLKGYGNAINAKAAQAFIECLIEK